AYQQMGASSFTEKPVGSGPYMVTSLNRPAGMAEFQANKSYWGGAPALDKITVLFVAAATTRLNRRKAGSRDAIRIPCGQVPTVQSDSNLTISSIDSNGVVFLGFNVTVPPLDNLKLRQAVDLSIDRDAITKNLLGGRAKPVGVLVSPVTFGYDPAFKPTAQ